MSSGPSMAGEREWLWLRTCSLAHRCSGPNHRHRDVSVAFGSWCEKKGKTDIQSRTHTCPPVMSTYDTRQRMAHETYHGFVWPCYGTCWAMRTSFDFDYGLGQVSFDDASNLPYDGTEEKTATHGLGWLLLGLLLPSWSLSC